MKPVALITKLVPMDSNYKVVARPFKFPAVKIDKLVFIRMPDEEMNDPETKKIMTDALQAAALKSGKTFILLPKSAEIVEITDKWESMVEKN